MTDIESKLARMRFSSAELCEAVSVGQERLTTKALTKFICEGIVIPAEPGGRGQGKGHKWNVKQVVGLACACHLWQSPRGAFWEFFSTTVAEFEVWPWAAIRALLALPEDDFDRSRCEEAFAQQIKDKLPPEDFDAVEAFLHPEDRDRALLLFERLLKIRRAVLARLALMEGRQVGAVHPRIKGSRREKLT
jgi:hypothetical protein